MTEFIKKPKQKLEKSFKEVLDENYEKVEFINNTDKEIKEQIKEMKDHYIDYLKKECSGESRWLDQHAHIITNENGIHIHVDENPDGISADAVLSSLHSCAYMHDMGISEFFLHKNAKKKLIIKENDICMNSCTFHADNKDERTLKNCINDCFLRTFNMTKIHLDEIKEKIDSVKDKLIL